MFGDGSRIRKVAIVENGAATLHKAFMEMALGLPYELFATFFAELTRSNRDSVRKVSEAHLINRLGIRNSWYKGYK